jgi:hypothetical protein
MLPGITTTVAPPSGAIQRACFRLARVLAPAMAALVLLAVSASAAAIISLDDAIDQLFAAARKGDAAKVEELLAKGVDANAKWRYDQTALFPASDKGNVAVIKVLLAHGANVNVEDTFYHASPLTWSIQNDHPEAAQLLIAAGAKDKAGALRYGVSKNYPAVVKAVLDAGGLDAKALGSALRRANILHYPEVAEMLTKAGAVSPPEATVDAETLKSYAGDYKPVAQGPDLSFVVKDGRLSGGVPGQGPPLTLIANDKTSFGTLEVDALMFTFKVEDGKVTGLTLLQGAKLEYKKVEAK